VEVVDQHQEAVEFALLIQEVLEVEVQEVLQAWEVQLLKLMHQVFQVLVLVMLEEMEVLKHPEVEEALVALAELVQVQDHSFLLLEEQEVLIKMLILHLLNHFQILEITQEVQVEEVDLQEVQVVEEQDHREDLVVALEMVVLEQLTLEEQEEQAQV
jgi:hypothetical protein